MERYVVIGEDGEGYIFACSQSCAETAAQSYDSVLGESQGSEGVDAFIVCDGCDGYGT
jgi:hypothetical protein